MRLLDPNRETRMSIVEAKLWFEQNDRVLELEQKGVNDIAQEQCSRNTGKGRRV